MLSHHLVTPIVGQFYITDRGYIALCEQIDPAIPLFKVFEILNTTECQFRMHSELASTSMFGKLEKQMSDQEVSCWLELHHDKTLKRTYTRRLSDNLLNNLPRQTNGEIIVENLVVSNPAWKEMSLYWEDRGFGDDSN